MTRQILIVFALAAVSLFAVACSDDNGSDNNGTGDCEATETCTADAGGEDTTSDTETSDAVDGDTTTDAADDTDDDTTASGGDADASDATDAADAADGGVDPGSEVPIAGGGFRIVRNGLYGGPILAMDRSVSQPDIVYAGTDGAGVYKSEDGGQTWEPTGMDAGLIVEIEVAPDDPDVVWVLREGPRISATTSSGVLPVLWKSTDGGQIFDEVAFPPEDDPDHDYYGHDIAASSASSGEPVLWMTGSVGLSREVHRTVDGGASWEPTDTTLPQSAFRVEAHASDSDIAWIVSQAGAYRTGDGGTSFTEMTPQLEQSEFLNNLVSSPSNPLELWLGVANGDPLHSTNGGMSWTRLDNAPGQSHQAFAGVESADDIWLVANRDTISVSDDGGSTWSSTTDPRSTMSLLRPRLEPRNAQDALVFGYAPEVIHTADGGNSWERSVEGIASVWSRVVDISPDGSRLVVGSDHGDVFVSDDKGASFTRSRAGLDPLAITGVAIDPTDKDVIYAATGDSQRSSLSRTNFRGALFKSIDGGQTFSRLTSPRGDGDYISGIDGLFVGYDGEVFVVEGTRVYRSDDGGLTWKTLQSTQRGIPSDVRKLPGTDSTSLTGILFTGGVDDIPAISDDLGASWTAIESDNQVLDIDRTELAESSRTDALHHYVYTRRAFAKYTGSTWARAEVGLATTPGRLPQIYGFGVGADGDSDVLIGMGQSATTDGTEWSLHVSQDDASTWSSTVIPFVGIPTDVSVADDDGTFAAIGLAGGRGLLVTRTAGQ